MLLGVVKIVLSAEFVLACSVFSLDFILDTEKNMTGQDYEKIELNKVKVVLMAILSLYTLCIM